jgi:hypothetical protein
MRYAALKAGVARAIAVMEPFISLGLKEGAHIIAASFYRGGTRRWLSADCEAIRCAGLTWPYDPRAVSGCGGACRSVKKQKRRLRSADSTSRESRRI